MFDKKKKWRFPGNNYLQEQGIDTPDMETFAQDPIASLARESCQNSIDARIQGKTARIEFKTFDIMRDLEIARSITCIIRTVMMRWRKIVQ